MLIDPETDEDDENDRGIAAVTSNISFADAFSSTSKIVETFAEQSRPGRPLR